MDMLRKISTDYYVYNQVEELFFLLLEKGKGKVHVFSSAWRIDIPYLLVKFQSIIGSVIFDEYDIANGFYTGFDECTLQLERYCLENACGVCYREFSLEHLTDILQFDIKGKTIRFFDYCSKENIGTESITEELSLCYAGGMITEEEYSDCPFAFSMELIEMFEKNQCHLHVYPSNWEENKFRTYVDKDRESKYFHFHKPVEYDKLPDELSHYDYGIVPVRDDVWENEESGYNTKYKYIYAATNKLFDYLDAGLPLIAGMPLKMAEYLEKKGVLLKWTNGQYDFDYLRAVKDDMQKQVEKIKEELNIKKQIGKLLAFYETL